MNRRVRMTRWGPVGTALALLTLACATNQIPEIPAVSAQPTGETHVGKFVWMDLVTTDVGRAQAFYGPLFGWTFAGDPADYVKVLHGDAVVAGMVPRDAGQQGSAWIGNLSVTDVDEAAAEVERRGGEIETGPVDAPHRGRLAFVRDPIGASVLLVRASGGDPPDALPPHGRFLWRELWTHDPQKAIGFYVDLVGYQQDMIRLDDQRYRVLKRDGVPRGGVMQAPPDVKPQWLAYVRVKDPTDAAQRAQALGARLVHQDEDAAILVDPTGAPFGVQRWDAKDAEATR